MVAGGGVEPVNRLVGGDELPQLDVEESEIEEMEIGYKQ